jgi:hypothetical protein
MSRIVREAQKQAARQDGLRKPHFQSECAL